MPASARRRKVLILEDEPFIAIMLEEELEALGLHVIGPVNNLEPALQLAEMPDLDGALLDLNINGAYLRHRGGRSAVDGDPVAVTRHRAFAILVATPPRAGVTQLVEC